MKIIKTLLKGRSYFLPAILSVMILASCKKDSMETELQDVAVSQVSPESQVEPGSTYVPNEILVKFKANSIGTARVNAFATIEGQVSERIHTTVMQTLGDNDGLYVVHTPMNVMEAIAQMKKNDNVEYAEPNYIYTHEAVSNDTYYTGGSLWGMYGSTTSPANQYGSGAGAAWANNHTGSAEVYVGVIDEGAMYNHADLNGNFWVNPYDPVDGVDNDGNGYVDDVRGWDFDGKNSSTYDGTQDDHGTHVSGTIGARGGNSIGVAGVNWNVTIISAKFLGRRGGTTANAIKAVDYITDLKTRHNLNIVATNNSWGGGGFSQGLQDAITRANNANILFVAAAGNGGNDGLGDNNDAIANYPSNYPNANVIAVASITSTGAKSSFSNNGATTVDIGAPGSSVVSTVPGNGGSSAYASYSGTSMATPHVTGACALYASTHPGSNAAQIKAAILSNAIPTQSLSGKCVSGGRLNVSGF